jgi:hypothetical protein
MFPPELWDSSPTVGWEIFRRTVSTLIFRGFQGLARSLIRKVHRPASKRADQKGSFNMSSQSPFTRTLVAIAAALAMSTVAVGAAVGPAQAVASPFQAPVYA